LSAVGERVGVQEPDLVLSEVALALRALDLHAGGEHVVAQRAQQRFDPAGAEDGVVDVVLVGGGELPVPGRVGLLVGRVEDDELELGARHGRPALCCAAVQLAAQDASR